MHEMRGAGIDVVTDEVEGQRVLDAVNRTNEILRELAKRKSAPETVVPRDKTPFKATAVSSADGAKILQNLENLANIYKNISGQRKNFLILDQVLQAQQYGSNSQYIYHLEEIDVSDGHNEAVEPEPTRMSDTSIPLANLIGKVGNTMESNKNCLEKVKNC